MIDKSSRLITILFIFSFIIVLFVSLSANYLIGYLSRTMGTNIEQRLKMTAELLAEYVTAEELDKYQNEEDMLLASYQDLRRRLLVFSERADVLYAYFARLVEDKLYYIVDNDFDEETQVGLGTPGLYISEIPWVFPVFNEGISVCTGLGVYTPGWEGLLTAFAPIFGSDGEVTAIAGVDIIDSTIVSVKNLVAFLTFFLVFMVVIVFFSGIIVFLRFRKQAETAREASLYKSKFLETMSHEIRTPLNAVIGISQIELHKEKLPDEYAQAFQTIFSSSISLLGIINEILDISKIETGKLELYSAVYDTSSLINDAVQINIVRIGSKPIEFILEVDENLPSQFYGDELRLKQILNNLLSNAIKYTEQGYVRLSIKHVKHNDKVELRFKVNDTGQGIKEEDRKNLFSEYTRFNAEVNRATEGTGIGLNITKKLIEMMDGTINVESEYGKGTLFTVTVMQKEVECPAIGAEVANQLRSFTFTGNNQTEKLCITRESMPYGNVLVVDDLETNIFVACGLLSPYKLNIDTASDGFTAIEKIDSGKKYDIVFMDHMMPKMDGIETTQKLRESGYTGTIVALTANALVGNDEIFAQNGFDGFISKPIDITHLNKILNKFIRDKQTPEVLKTAGRQTEQIEVRSQSGQCSQQSVTPEVAGFFLRDAKKSASIMESIYLNKFRRADDISMFIINIHAIKSALATVGEMTLSLEAEKLEKAGRDKDIHFIFAQLPVFLENLNDIIRNFEAKEKKPDEEKKEVGDTSFLKDKLFKISEACSEMNKKTAKDLLAEIRLKSWQPSTEECLDNIAGFLLHSDFDEVIKTIDEFVINLN